MSAAQFAVGMLFLFGCLVASFVVGWLAWIVLHALFWDRSCCSRRWRILP